MSDAERPIAEDDLHAYVDNLLCPERLPVVQRYLRENAEQASKVAAYRAQREALRSAMEPYGSGPIPPWLHPRILETRRQDRRRLVWRSAAAVTLAFGLGVSGGWALHGRLLPDPSDLTVLTKEAVANHVVYAADRRRPTELGADQRDDLARWVSNRLNHKVAPPDLSGSGYHYMGGRLAATPEGPAGMFMYQNDSGVRLTIFVRPDGKARNTPMEAIATKPMGGCAWIEHGVGYTVVAPVSATELHEIAKKVQQLLDTHT